MPTLFSNNQTRMPFISVLCLSIILAAPVMCRADIYRFVTVDGVETFTDAPVNKHARVVIKEHTTSSNRHKRSKTQKIHNVSLDEIVEKTINASILPPG
jgi:peroxiredoxin family protein